MNTQQTIKSYCRDRDITLEKFSQITGVPCTTIYRIQEDRNANITINTIRKIYNGTNNHFGVPLDLWDYINH